MKITRIHLTNFRSFSNTQTIDFAPLTLLFGPNSTGKSSVLMALAYIQQILKKGHCNPQKLDTLGNKTIGGFRSLVHAQDLKKAIKIRLDYSPGKSPFVSYGAYVDEMAAHLQSAQYMRMNDFGGGIKDGAIEFEIAWSERFNRAYVRNYRVWINSIYIGCIHSSEDQKNTLLRELNTLHPLFVPSDNEDWLVTEYGEPDQRETLKADDNHTQFEQIVNELNPNPASITLVSDEDASETKFINRIAPIALSCRSGAVPLLGVPVTTNLLGQNFDEVEDHFNFLVVQQVLSQAFVLPLDKLLEFLDASVHIGPLRVVPDNNYIPNPDPEQNDWVDGSAAWDLIHKNPDNDDAIRRLLDNTSEWFASRDKLDAGYEIINKSIAECLSGNFEEQNSDLLNKRHLFFKELRSDILMSINQLGTGISQLLPIVVAANHDDIELISVEQPELHIHPRLQVETGDLFLVSRKKHMFLIETHSEHIILRILRRIRETYDEDLPKAVTPVFLEDIAVNYLHPTEDGLCVKKLRINEEGEFIDKWPSGFFSERVTELF